MAVLVVDVKEDGPTAAGWAKKVEFGFPLLLDESGKVAASYAPAGVVPEKYSRAETSDLTTKVEPGSNTIDFPLPANR